MLHSVLQDPGPQVIHCVSLCGVGCHSYQDLVLLVYVNIMDLPESPCEVVLEWTYWPPGAVKPNPMLINSNSILSIFRHSHHTQQNPGPLQGHNFCKIFSFLYITLIFCHYRSQQ